MQTANVRVKDIDRVKSVVVTTEASANTEFAMTILVDEDNILLAEEWLTPMSPNEIHAKERREWLQESLAGLERWEAAHGFGQGDDV